MSRNPIAVVTAPRERRERKRFMRSLEETAARAIVTATVTFAVGWVLKKMFEQSIAEAAHEGAAAGVATEVAASAADGPVPHAFVPSEAGTAPAQPIEVPGHA